MNVELRGRRVLVVGLARSGIAAAAFCARRGAAVTVNDARAQAQLAGAIEKLAAEAGDASAKIERVLGGHPAAAFEGKDLVVLSPGVPPSLPGLAAARASGAEIISEIELASRYITAPVVAITGTNGKTTTTSMIGDVFRRGGRATFVGGNIGDPLTHALAEGARWDVVVAELSSFQLEAVATFAPAVGVHLNLTPDHLDRYDGMEGYAAAKQRLFAFQREDQHAVVNADDPYAAIAARASRASVWPFSTTTALQRGAFLDGEEIVLRMGDREERYDGRGRRTLGRHNLSNHMVAALCGRLLGAPREAIEESLARFEAPPHRLELVAERGGVRYVNDSKATNVDSVLRSLESIAPPIRLIAGGRHKGSPYAPLRDLARARVAALYTIGEAGPLIEAELSSVVPCVPCGDLASAVARAARDARAGDTVLLSPACSSYDQFRDYEERGAAFRALVGALP